MTVAELIDRLSELPANAIVIKVDDDGQHRVVSSLEHVITQEANGQSGINNLSEVIL